MGVHKITQDFLSFGPPVPALAIKESFIKAAGRQPRSSQVNFHGHSRSVQQSTALSLTLAADQLELLETYLVCSSS